MKPGDISTPAQGAESHPQDRLLIAAGALLDELIADWIPLALRDEELSREVAKAADANGWATVKDDEIVSFHPEHLTRIQQLEISTGSSDAGAVAMAAAVRTDRLADFVRTLQPSTMSGLVVHARAFRWTWSNRFYLRPPSLKEDDDCLVYNFAQTVERLATAGGR